MATVNALRKIALERDSKHSNAECTYSVITDELGQKLLQIDTYGSPLREMPGKKSQSIRFTPEAIKQLMFIIQTEIE
jgi:hypothetical protein